MTLAWYLWNNRNEYRHGGKKKGEWELAQWTKNYLLEYQAANVSSPMPPLDLVGSWIPPLSPQYKVNVDGARFSSRKESGVGVIIRDNRGLIVDALSKKIDVPLGPLEIEAKAFKISLYAFPCFSCCYCLWDRCCFSRIS